MFLFKRVHIVIIAIIMIFSVDACDNIVDNEEKGLNNNEDQARVNELLKGVNRENYATRTSELSLLYGRRLQEIGLESNRPDKLINKIYEVWPTNFKGDREKFVSSIRDKIKSYRKVSKKSKLGEQEQSPLAFFIQSKEADTAFSDTEKKFLSDSKNIFEKENRKVSYYVSELDSLSSRYQKTYDLTSKEYATIVGVSKSVGTLIEVLSNSEEQFAKLSKHTRPINKAGFISYSYLLQTTDCADIDPEPTYIGPNCEFDPNWPEIGRSATLGATLGMLGTTSRLGYYMQQVVQFFRLELLFLRQVISYLVLVGEQQLVQAQN